MGQKGDSRQAFGRQLKELRGKWTQETLARKLGVGQSKVSDAERGVLSETTAQAYDRLFGTMGKTPQGKIIDKWRKLGRVVPPGAPVQGTHPHVDLAALAQAGGGLVVVMPLPGEPQFAELLADTAGGRTLPLPDGPYQVIPITGEVSPSHRRGLLLHMATTPLVADALDRADKVYHSLAASAPDPWTLDELAEDAVAMAARYWSTPLDRLLPEVLDRWYQLANMLDRGPVGAAGQRVVELAGTYAYYVARIGRHTGDRLLAAKFGRIAARCAELSGDPLLIGSVACDRSCESFDAARYTEAADIAGRAAGQSHPYNRARLHAYRAEALAAGGHPDETREALAQMRANVVDLPRMPGSAWFDDCDQLIFSAMVLVELGDSHAAEAFAREALAGTPTTQYMSHGHAWVTIGKALTGHDPGAAADAGLRAAEANTAWPTVDIEARIRDLHRTLAREHCKVAEVVQLGEAVAALRPAVAI